MIGKICDYTAFGCSVQKSVLDQIGFVDILYRTGIFTDGSGKETIVKAGSITLARPGQSHALRNEKDEPLVFLDVIAQNDTYQQNHPEASAK